MSVGSDKVHNRVVVQKVIVFVVDPFEEVQEIKGRVKSESEACKTQVTDAFEFTDEQSHKVAADVFDFVLIKLVLSAEDFVAQFLVGFGQHLLLERQVGNSLLVADDFEQVHHIGLLYFSTGFVLFPTEHQHVFV